MMRLDTLYKARHQRTCSLYDVRIQWEGLSHKLGWEPSPKPDPIGSLVSAFQPPGWLGHSVYILVWQLRREANVHILLVLFLWIQMPSFSVSETISITLTFSVLKHLKKSHPQNNFLFEVSQFSCVSYEAAHLFRFYISSGVNYF